MCHDGGADAATQESAELQKRIVELEDRWRRALADLDNLRKRTARDAEQLRARERAHVASEWLSVLDNLGFALEHAKADPGAIVDGVRAVRDQAEAVMARLGFPRRDDEAGTPFDPTRHEAVGTVAAADVPPGTIVHVVRPGYGDGEQQLRPAAVVVAKGSA
ncbi:MAG: nucleotide exchange factor GrpE [Pseudonocardiaceae bacterium]